METHVYLAGKGIIAVDLSDKGSCDVAKSAVIENAIPGQREVIDNRQILCFFINIFLLTEPLLD